jgi:hypothetical protein
MFKIVAICRRIALISSAVFVSLAFTPLVAFADTPSCTPPASQTGINRPVGADASTYAYNCATGLWENAHYSYNPATGQYTALDPAVYTYNPSTGQYDTTSWMYNAPAGNYMPVTQSVGQPPAGASVVGGPPAPSSPGPDSISNTGPDSNNTINDNGGAVGGSINNTGPNSSNSLDGSINNNLTANNTTNAGITNLLDGVATTGNTLVIGNTTAGDATSGSAQDIANVVNMLQSSSNALGGNTVTFVANLNGDVNGDLLVDPSALGTVQPAGSSPTVGNNNLTLNNQTNAAINNTINLVADSGNASVADNTSGGNATSGNAEAIANVVNLIDSAITSGNSFVGVININGNFNGNILVPPDLINQLIASNVPTVTITNTGPSSNNTITQQTGSNNTAVNNTNNEGINNTVNSAAKSGQATVANNTTAGNATSGSAATNLTAFNLTGSSVIGANDLLVFVNVLGQWVGMIVNAPPGATAAELGGGITQTGQSNNTTTVHNTANEQINNNINVNAQSGDASVTGNTKGGNATSGNADTAVNLLNVEGSNLALSNWFGILFINVFGTWNGNFGIAPISSPADMVGGAMPSTGGASTTTTPATMAVFRFAPSAAGSSSGNQGNSGPSASISNTGPGSTNIVASHQVALHGPTPALSSGHNNIALPLIGSVLFGLYVIADVTHTVRQRAKRAS